MLPLGNRVVVKPEKKVSMVGKIVIPEAYQKDVNRGTVVIPGTKSRIPAGSKIAYNKDSAVPIEYEGEMVDLVDDNTILAVL